MKRILIVLGLVMVWCAMVGCGKSRSGEDREADTMVWTDASEEPMVEVVEENADSVGSYAASGVIDAASRYRTMYDEMRNAYVHLIRADGKKIWYNPCSDETQSTYFNILYVYDSETDRQTAVNLNRTSLPDEEMQVEDMVDHNGIITIIMSEMRNSNGWLDGTYVWQYNCYDNSWKALAKACSGAEFVNDRNAVSIDNAECLNPEDDIWMQEYRHHYRTVRL